MHSNSLRDRLWDTTLFEIHFKISLPCSFIEGDSRPPLLLGLHPSLDFTSEMNESLIEDAFLNPALIHTQWHSLRNKQLLTCHPSLPFSEAIHSPAPPPPPLPLPPPPPPPPVPSQLPFYNTIQLIRKWDPVCFNAFWSELLKGPSLV